MFARAALLTSLLLTSAPAPHVDRLAVYDRGAWRTWWRADAARTRWDAPNATLTRALKWQRMRPGLEMAELRIAARAPALRVRVIVLRIDPQQFDWRLAETRDDAGKPHWETEATPAGAALSFNAGQFDRVHAWGWVVRDGHELQPPGKGPLAGALVVDRAGKMQLLKNDEIEGARTRGDVVTAFQSYPVLLEDDGSIPEALRAEGTGVDLHHRDSRLAVGELRDGKLLLALTRYDIGGGLLRPVPIGPTTPEMAAIMGALGCRTAMMLDGGISSQLLVRDAAGHERVWPAYRWVPLGLIASARSAAPPAKPTASITQ